MRTGPKFTLRLFALLLSVLLAQAASGQSLTLRSFAVDEFDLSARTYERLDLNGERCALIKVQLPLDGCVFEGSKVGDVEYKVNEYWLYVTPGTKRIKIKCPGLESSMIVWEERIGNYGVTGGYTYLLHLDGYNAGSSTPAREGNYMIFTLTPPDATVKVDGQQQAPPKDGKLSVFMRKGSHTYEVSAFGYSTEAGSFSMGVEKQELTVSLSSTMARLTVDCETAGAAFYINDELKGTGSWTGQLSPGSYRIEARKDGCRTQVREISLGENARETVHFPSLSAVLGILNVSYDPIDSQVWLDGKSLGTSPGLWDVGVGSHKLEIKCEGYVAETRTVTVAEGKETLVKGSLGKATASVSTKGKTAEQLNAEGEAAYDRKDYAAAFKLYKAAAEKGNASAQCVLGCYYEAGLGVAQDMSKAVAWYRKSAEQGFDGAQFLLGICYEKGSGVAVDYDEAVKWYRRSAEQGFADAQCALGNCYEIGLGVAQDMSEAFAWYRKSAEQGDAIAQFNLGICYDKGSGVTKDSSEAVKWYRKSAEQGNAYAQYNLGVCYYNGTGVTKDYAEAMKWFRKAAANGYEGAKEMLNALK